MTKPFYCWQCKYFRPDNVATLRSGRCHRYAPHSLDLYGFVRTAANSHVAYAASEDESANSTTNYAEKLSCLFDAVAGSRYAISWYHEIGINPISGGEFCNVEARVQINDVDTISKSNWWRYVDNTERYGENTGGMYVTESLDGAVHVDIDFRKLADQTAYIRRARILITRLLKPDDVLYTSSSKYSQIYDAGPGMWCGQFRLTNNTIPALPAP